MITIYYCLFFHSMLKIYKHTIESIMFDTDKSYDVIHNRDYFLSILFFNEKLEILLSSIPDFKIVTANKMLRANKISE